MSFLGKWLFKLGYTQSDKDDKEKAAAKSKPPSGRGRNNPSRKKAQAKAAAKSKPPSGRGATAARKKAAKRRPAPKDDKEKAAAKSKPPSGRNNPSKPTAAQKDEMHRRRLINRERQLDAAHDLAMPVKYTKTKGGTYPTFKKKSTSAGSFRDAFKSARAKAKKAGNADGGTFMWGGRKYNTKQK